MRSMRAELIRACEAGEKMGAIDTFCVGPFIQYVFEDGKEPEKETYDGALGDWGEFTGYEGMDNNLVVMHVCLK